MNTANQLPELPTPKYSETIRGVPCITLTEHEHLMRTYALQAIAKATQPADVTDEQILALNCVSLDSDEHGNSFWVDEKTVLAFARAILALRPVQGVPIGEVGTMPGTSGFTMACFRADEVPVGTKIYTTPQPTQATQVEVTDAEIDALCLSLTGFMTRKERDRAVARAILALCPQPAEKRVPMPYRHYSEALADDLIASGDAEPVIAAHSGKEAP